MHHPDEFIDALGERLGAPFNATRMTVEPVESHWFASRLHAWMGGDDVSTAEVAGYSVGSLGRDIGTPTFSALILLGWLDSDLARLLPPFEAHYAALSESPFRRDDVGPVEIARRLVREAGIYSDGPLLGYDILACMPEIQLAFWEWWSTGTMPDLRAEGFSVRQLSSGAKPSHPVQALLSLDWLMREPERARAWLSE